MVTFVELTEEDASYHLVVLLNDLVNPPAATEKKTTNEDGEAKAEAKDDDEEEEDPVIKRAKETPLGQLVQKHEYAQLLNGPGGLFELMPKLVAADPEVFEAGFSLGFYVLQKYEASRVEAAKKRSEEREVAAKAEKRKKKKTEQELTDSKEAWSKSELERSKAEDQARDNIIKTFAKILTDDEKSPVRALRLQLLSVLFNTLDETSSMRHPIFLSILKYAKAADLLSLLDGVLESVDSWVPQWKLSSTQLGELYELVAEIAPQETRQGYILEFLKHMEESKGSSSSSSSAKGGSSGGNTRAKALAAQACVVALKAYQHSDQIQHDCSSLLNYKLIQELRDDAAYAPLLELVKIYATKTITEYFQFHNVAANAKCLEQHGLSHDDVCQTLRTLTLCCMGTEKEVLTYTEIKQKLQLQDNMELETAVIEAVMSNRLQAKIDQENEVVVVQRTTARVFEDKDWAILGAKLEDWGGKIAHVLANMRNIPERALTPS